MDQLRFLWNRLRGRDTVLEITPLGEPTLVLAIAGRREIRRAHEVQLEGPLIQRMFQHLCGGDLLWDIGANVGLISLLMVRHNPAMQVTVHAFEPEPRNFRQLVRNLDLNDLAGPVTPHRLALGADEGEAELFVRGGPGEGRHSIAASRGSTGSIRVPLATASAFARTHRAWPTMVKLDVEGAEGQVLSGMAGLLDERPPRDIFLEIHPKGDGDRMPAGVDGGAPPLIHEWLEARGYRMAWCRPRRSGEHRHYRR